MTILADLPSLLPLHFFSMTLQAKEGKSLSLPSTAALLGEESFADVEFTWMRKGIEVSVHYHSPFEEALYPDFSKGNSVELFFDTRDVKSAGFATKFCHHFIFLPEEVHGVKCQEITHFRTDDTHPLCDPSLLSCRSTFSKRSFSMEIFVSKDALHGYDPDSFNRLGLTYRLHAPGRPAQHFSLSSSFYKIEQSPSLWCSIYLCLSKSS